MNAADGLPCKRCRVPTWVYGRPLHVWDADGLHRCADLDRPLGGVGEKDWPNIERLLQQTGLLELPVVAHKPRLPHKTLPL